MMKRLCAVTVRGGVAQQENISPRLETWQAIVRGWVEHVSLRGRFQGLHLWCNEEGRLQNLPLYACPLYPGPLAGDFFVTRLDADGEATSLEPADVALVLEAFDAEGR